MKANYTIKYIGQENCQQWYYDGSSGTDTEKRQRSYKVAEIWVDADGMPIQAKIVESNNDTTTVLLSKIQKNITINANVFDLQLPKRRKESFKVRCFGKYKFDKRL